MTCLFCNSFSTALCYPFAAPIQERKTWRLTGRRLTAPLAKRTAIKLYLSISSGGSALSPSRRNHFNTVTPAKQCLNPDHSHFGVSSSAHLLISGFWVGPDVDDGWGFVEAFVQLIC